MAGIVIAGLYLIGMAGLAIFCATMDEGAPASEEMTPEATELQKAA